MDLREEERIAASMRETNDILFEKLSTTKDADFIIENISEDCQTDYSFLDDMEKRVGNNKYHVPKSIARAKAKAQRKARAKSRKK